MKRIIKSCWEKELEKETNKEEFYRLAHFLKEEREKERIFPPEEEVFNAFRYSSFKETKVLILGQDPYPTRGMAHGLAFSAKEGNKLPRSLKNIFRELKEDLGIERTRGDLTDWAKQGVLLLNSTLTVREGKPGSHFRKGWEAFTDGVIKKLVDRPEGVVVVLWGRVAKKKYEMLYGEVGENILTATHPSPLSVKGFFGCKHFSKINRLLLRQGKAEIIWAEKNV